MDILDDILDPFWDDAEWARDPDRDSELLKGLAALELCDAVGDSDAVGDGKGDGKGDVVTRCVPLPLPKGPVFAFGLPRGISDDLCGDRFVAKAHALLDRGVGPTPCAKYFLHSVCRYLVSLGATRAHLDVFVKVLFGVQRVAWSSTGSKDSREAACEAVVAAGSGCKDVGMVLLCRMRAIRAQSKVVSRLMYAELYKAAKDKRCTACLPVRRTKVIARGSKIEFCDVVSNAWTGAPGLVRAVVVRFATCASLALECGSSSDTDSMATDG